MNFSKKAFSHFMLFGGALLGPGLDYAFGDQLLIKEVDGLRNSLVVNDPTRQTLTLRLADLLFQEALSLAKNPEPSKAEEQRIVNYRKRSVSLYIEAMTGGGRFRPITGSQKHKIQFQLARLYADMNQAGNAKPLWTTLVNQTELLDLRREAALRLAELAEKGRSSAAAAEADRYYRLAIELCGGGDICSYSHYRRAWLFRNQQNLKAAIEEMKLALWDSKNQVREESLRDLINFLALMPGDGTEALTYVEDLALKLSRPSLLSDLSGAYYSVGNKGAGTKVLAYINQKTPNLKAQIKLAEEYYGLREWEEFRAALDSARSISADQTLETSEGVEAEKILRRLTIQLDGERISQPKFAADFKQTVALYLQLFPSSKERTKMFEGWLAAETDPAAKMLQIKNWIESDRFNLSVAEQTKLRELRAFAAQKSKNHSVVAEEMAELASSATAAEKKREYRYLQARSLYESKAYDQALPIFLELASLDGNATSADRWAIQSQNLALDIYGQHKQYGELTAQADSWLRVESLRKDPKLAKELAEMKQVSEQASFELATAAGKTPEALALFKTFCLEGKFAAKACENAQILAVHLKDEASLITILKARKLTNELAGEYEAAAYFADAAAMLEPDLSKADANNQRFLKVALLFELAQQEGARDRILRRLMDRPMLRKSLGAEEDLIYQTLEDAHLLDASAFRLAWNRKNRLRLAETLQSADKGTPETRRMLLTSTESTGAAWASLVLEETRKLNEAQSKIQFHGRNGQRKFESRLVALKKLIQYSERYLNGADTKTRIEILAILLDAHKGLSQEILNSPIPEQIEPAAAEELKASLEKVAQPFSEKALAYDNLRKEQLGKDVIAAPVGAAPERSSDSSAYQTAVTVLHSNPNDSAALADLKTYFEGRGQARLAYYFQGRLLQLQKGAEGTNQ